MSFEYNIHISIPDGRFKMQHFEYIKMHQDIFGQPLTFNDVRFSILDCYFPSYFDEDRKQFHIHIIDGHINYGSKIALVGLYNDNMQLYIIKKYFDKLYAAYDYHTKFKYLDFVINPNDLRGYYIPSINNIPKKIFDDNYQISIKITHSDFKTNYLLNLSAYDGRIYSHPEVYNDAIAKYINNSKFCSHSDEDKDNNDDDNNNDNN